MIILKRAVWAIFINRLSFIINDKAVNIKIRIIDLLFKVIAIGNSFDFELQYLTH